MTKTPLAIAGIAALIAAIGGACQRAEGPGSQPGLALTHLGAAIFVCAIVAAIATAFVAWLATESPAPVEPDPQPYDQPAPRVFIAANDGRTTIPVVGPYDTEADADTDLPGVRNQFDPEHRYTWTVEATHDDTIVGHANRYADCYA